MEDTLTTAGCLVVIILVCWIFAEGINLFGRWLWSRKR